MRLVPALFALALTACGPREEPPPLPEAPAQAAPAPWFICDALDAPALFVFTQDGAVVHVAEYDKPNGAVVARTDYQIGAQEGAAGSVYTNLIQNGAEAGAVRQINEGVLETPGAAYTAPITSVRLGERTVACRWMPRTRLMGVTGRRTIVVHEDSDGDLIYTSYNFSEAGTAHAIDLSENGRSTTFSAEVRGGAENVSPTGAAFTFENAGYRYVVAAGRNGAGSVEVWRDGARVQAEPFVAFQMGSCD